MTGALKAGDKFVLATLKFHNEYGFEDNYYTLIDKIFGVNEIVEYKPMRNVLKYKDAKGKLHTEKADEFFKPLAKASGSDGYKGGEYVFEKFPQFQDVRGGNVDTYDLAMLMTKAKSDDIFIKVYNMIKH